MIRPLTRAVRAGALGLVIGGLISVLPAAPVAADPAGPTDYRSEVIELIPPTPQIVADIIGGDSFLHLSVSPGTEVVVLGYAAEPYLRIDASGGIWENRRSPATYYNDERYGAEIPAFADPTAEPEWTRIADGHDWAWHDHRIHRMETYPPLNSSRGEEILDAMVPLVVDGQRVQIHVTSVWMAAPSPAPAILGALVAMLAIAGWALSSPFGRSLRATRLAGALVLPFALAATVVGLWQFASLPGSTDPQWTWWVLPLVALIAGGSVAISRPKSVATAGAALAIAGTQLVIWALQRRAGMWRAILPTDAPWWLDRAVTAATFPTAIAALALGIWVLSPRRPRSPL